MDGYSITSLLIIGLVWITGWYLLCLKWKDFSNNKKIGYIFALTILGPFVTLLIVREWAESKRTPTRPILDEEEEESTFMFGLWLWLLFTLQSCLGKMYR